MSRTYAGSATPASRRVFADTTGPRPRESAP